MRPRALLVEVLNNAFGGRGWHGTTVLGSLRGLTARQLLRRPSPRRHNIWELALHIAYWKYAVTRRLTGERTGGFPRRPSNWPALPTQPTIARWREDMVLLRETHASLIAAVRALPESRLQRRTPSGEWRISELIHGAAAHDAYHCGQIQLLKRLMRKR